MTVTLPCRATVSFPCHSEYYRRQIWNSAWDRGFLLWLHYFWKSAMHIYSLPCLLLTQQVAWRDGGPCGRFWGVAGGAGGASPHRQGVGSPAERLGGSPGQAGGPPAKTPSPQRGFLCPGTLSLALRSLPGGLARPGRALSWAQSQLIPALVATRHFGASLPLKPQARNLKWNASHSALLDWGWSEKKCLVVSPLMMESQPVCEVSSRPSSRTTEVCKVEPNAFVPSSGSSVLPSICGFNFV